MNPFATRISATNQYIIPVSVMCLILGFMFSLAWLTKENRDVRLNSLGPDQRARLSYGTLDLEKENRQLAGEVQKMRAENTKLQNALASESGQGKLLNESLQEAKMLAGITEVEGPGIVITLTDKSEAKIDAPLQEDAIHDTDVLRVVNELWNAGAEAIAVNGQRVSAGTSFRCVGSVILVNNVRIAPPVKIQAVGDTQTLLGAMKLPGGVLAEIREVDPSMVKMSEVQKMRLPAFAGSTNRKYSSVPKEAK